MGQLARDVVVGPLRRPLAGFRRSDGPPLTPTRIAAIEPSSRGSQGGGTIGGAACWQPEPPFLPPHRGFYLRPFCLSRLEGLFPPALRIAVYGPLERHPLALPDLLRRSSNVPKGSIVWRL
jgi:hypothetical protein